MDDQREFDFGAEASKRDTALDRLRKHRSELIVAAFIAARRHEAKHGEVTSTDVLAALRADPAMKIRLAGKDTRFMGAVFRRKGWKRLRWDPKGSHCRPVAVWAWQP